MGNISLRKIEAEDGLQTRTKHGVRAYLDGGKLPSGRAWKREWAAIQGQYAEIIERYGGDKIRPEVKALLEGARDARTIRGLGLLYVKKAGIMRRDAIKRGDLAMHSVLCSQFIAYLNAERLNLEAAARLANQASPEPATDVLTYIRAVDEAKDVPAPDQGEGEIARPDASQSDTTAKEGDI